MQITSEVLKEIQACKSADELIAKAAQAGIELTQTQAAGLLNSTNADLDLDDLDTVAGGASCSDFEIDIEGTNMFIPN